MSETYTYAIADFPNGNVDVDALEVEIRASSIVTALDHVMERQGTPHEVDCVFKDALSSGDKSTLDGLVAAHDGDPIPGPSAPPVRLEPTGREDVRLTMKGERFTAKLGDTTQLDVSFAHDRFLQGVEGFVSNASVGDYIEVFAVQPSSPEVVLAQLGETVYVPPGGRMSVTSESAMNIPMGVKIRFVYTSVASSGTQPEVVLHLRTWRKKN